MVGIEGTSGSLTGTTHRAIVTEEGRIWVVTGSGFQSHSIDSIHAGPIVTDALHHETHDGNAYDTCRQFLTLANGGSADIFMAVGTIKQPHMTIELGVGGDGTFELFEGTTVSDSGTSITSFNMNRSSPNITDSKLFHTPVVTASGTVLCTMFLPGGTKQQATGGQGGQRDEWMLHTGSTYMFRIINRAGGNKNYSFKLQYYEENPL